MKELRNKIATVLKYVYGIGIAVALFAGALTLIGYIVAFIVGGELATEICVFIYKKIYPVIIYISSVSVLIGLVKMYFAGEKALTSSSDNMKRKVKKSPLDNTNSNQQNKETT